MLFLLISVCLSVAVSVLLKLARRRQLEVTQMVAVNYPVAALLTWLLAQPSWADADGFWSWWWLFVLLGVLLPLVFVIMGRAVQAAGIVRADAAQRVALVIPLLAAFLLFGERLSWWSAAGIALVFAALAALLQRDSSAGEGDGRHAALWLTGVWLGYGVIDVLLKRLSLATAGRCAPCTTETFTPPCAITAPSFSTIVAPWPPRLPSAPSRCQRSQWKGLPSSAASAAVIRCCKSPRKRANASMDSF